jgi:ribosomal protein S20
VYPSLAFDNLFENRGLLRNASILDRVRTRAQALSQQVSATDKAKIDEYLTSVREVEKRVERMRADKHTADEKAQTKNKPVWSMERPANGLPEDLREHTRLMCDIVALGFQTDRTRVATMILANDLSAQIYPFLQVREGHHGASHNNLSDGYERISRFHLSQLAYLAAKLDAMPEGNGTVLDNSCLLWMSNMWSGRKHDNTRLPLVMAGGLGGTIETGRHLDYLGAGDENRRLCNLFLSIMHRMGIKADRFGDADAPLARL